MALFNFWHKKKEGTKEEELFPKVDLHAHILQQLDEVLHVTDVGNIVYSDWLAGEQGGTDHLQGLVLGSLRCNGTAERMSAFDDE